MVPEREDEHSRGAYVSRELGAPAFAAVVCHQSGERALQRLHHRPRAHVGVCLYRSAGGGRQTGDRLSDYVFSVRSSDLLRIADVRGGFVRPPDLWSVLQAPFRGVPFPLVFRHRAVQRYSWLCGLEFHRQFVGRVARSGCKHASEFVLWSRSERGTRHCNAGERGCEQFHVEFHDGAESPDHEVVRPRQPLIPADIGVSGQPPVVLPVAISVYAHIGRDTRSAGTVVEDGAGAYGDLCPSGTGVRDE